MATVAGLSAAPVAAEAATVTTGYHERAVVECNLMVGNSMLVHAPMILAAPVSVPGNVFIVGDPHTQWVAYRATLLRWDGTRYAASTRGRWISSQVPSEMNNFIGASYLEWTGSQWVPSQSNGATYFSGLPAGSYRVSIEYHWYPDSQVGPGDDVLEASDYTYTLAYSLQHYSYCQY